MNFAGLLFISEIAVCLELPSIVDITFRGQRSVAMETAASKEVRLSFLLVKLLSASEGET